MVCKHSALFAVVVASALAGFSGAALSDDKAADKGGWAQPNVTGMPGYKEPPKGPDEPEGTDSRAARRPELGELSPSHRTRQEISGARHMRTGKRPRFHGRFF